MASSSEELLNVGKRFDDPLLVTREKPTRLPPSSALSRAKLFLPQLQKANQDLEKLVSSGKDKELDIENVQEDEPVIEMNLMMYEEDSSSDEDGEEGSAEDSDTDILIGEVTEENIRLPNQQQGKKPLILEISSSDSPAARDDGRTELKDRATASAPKTVSLHKKRRKGKNASKRTNKKRTGKNR